MYLSKECKWQTGQAYRKVLPDIPGFESENQSIQYLNREIQVGGTGEGQQRGFSDKLHALGNALKDEIKQTNKVMRLMQSEIDTLSEALKRKDNRGPSFVTSLMKEIEEDSSSTLKGKKRIRT